VNDAIELIALQVDGAALLVMTPEILRSLGLKGGTIAKLMHLIGELTAAPKVDIVQLLSSYRCLSEPNSNVF
jgi:hypothetical protein